MVPLFARLSFPSAEGDIVQSSSIRQYKLKFQGGTEMACSENILFSSCFFRKDKAFKESKSLYSLDTIKARD